MKIVIDIPEDDYNFIKDLQFYHLDRRSGKTIEQNVINGIKNGTPLPKGHGGLIDTNALIMELDEYNEYATFDCNAIKDLIDDAPTVISEDNDDINVDVRKRCANCKYQNLLFDDFPCIRCVRNPKTNEDMKEDMWKHENE